MQSYNTNTYSIQIFSIKKTVWHPEGTLNQPWNSTTCRPQNNFERDNFISGAFIDLPKAFDTVDHNILFKKKLEINGNADKNLKWFKNYLNNRKQYIQINNEEKTNLLLVKGGVPQGSILGPLIFVTYITDVQCFF